jgi:rare lipoprotein A
LNIRRLATIFMAAAFVAGCATHPPPAPPSSANQVRVPSTAGIYKIGNPYEEEGIWYYPREQPDYDETGVASWYGPQFHGQRTADGEIFDLNSISAAHRTLPMPVNVRVTNLENGRSLIVRVNDRGPFARGRIIDLSEHAADLLGFKLAGTARVRVTYIARADLPNGEPQPVPETPPAIAAALPATPTTKVDTAALNIVPGTPVAPPVTVAELPAPLPPTPPPSAQPDVGAAPTGVVTHVPVPAVTHLYIQAGAFSSIDNANRLKTRLSSAGAVFVSEIKRNGQKLYRVRMGPFDALDEADTALAQLVKLGSNDAQIVVDQ